MQFTGNGNDVTSLLNNSMRDGGPVFRLALVMNLRRIPENRHRMPILAVVPAYLDDIIWFAVWAFNANTSQEFMG